MKATINQVNELAPLVKKLWPEHSIEDVTKIVKEYIEGDDTAIFVHVLDDVLVGIALTCLRNDYVEGCETSPVGYLEGIFVDEEYRNIGIGKVLCHECEQWAKNKGCTEFASDCELTNDLSFKFHLAIGFNEENRIIHFKKTIN